MVAQQQESNMQRVKEAIEQPMEMAREYPMSSMLVVFGVGLGVGVLLSQVACSAMHHEPTFRERLSQQIYDAVNQVIPDSVRGQLNRLHS
jgi:hypothetical protein